jgi:leader peptidase (prepilin peptidase)/N-methyltransferase
VIHRVTGRAEWGAKIPFGPYLAMGAVLWIFYGPQVVDWYISKTMWR